MSQRKNGAHEWISSCRVVGGRYCTLTLTTSPNLSGPDHDRRAPGLNHLAFGVGSPAKVDEIMGAARQHGWRPLYQERYPWAGGPDHYAGWLENSAGFKAEIVAESSSGTGRDRDRATGWQTE